MSIYLVKLCEWFPPGDELYEICSSIIEFSRCESCGKKLSFRKAIGHHSIPWGNGNVFCSLKCTKSTRQIKPDRRRIRRWKRKYSKLGWEYE